MTHKKRFATDHKNLKKLMVEYNTLPKMHVCDSVMNC